MFDRLIWQPDRMMLGDLVFRLEHFKNDRWELADNCFIFYKTQYLVEQYAHFWATRPAFRAAQVLELGLWDGGSAAFWFELFGPAKYIGVDIQQKRDSPYFRRYVAERQLEDRLRLRWGVDQSDSSQLRQIVAQEFQGPLDLVIDDASHMYRLTRASFETLFPLLRPGGLYVIEDWAWGHWKEFQASSHPWAKEMPLTKLIIELIGVTGSAVGVHNMASSLIASVNTYQGFTVVERGGLALDPVQPFDLERYLSKPNRGWVS